MFITTEQSMRIIKISSTVFLAVFVLLFAGQLIMARAEEADSGETESREEIGSEEEMEKTMAETPLMRGIAPSPDRTLEYIQPLLQIEAEWVDEEGNTLAEEAVLGNSLTVYAWPVLSEVHGTLIRFASVSEEKVTLDVREPVLVDSLSDLSISIAGLAADELIACETETASPETAGSLGTFYNGSLSLLSNELPYEGQIILYLDSDYDAEELELEGEILEIEEGIPDDDSIPAILTGQFGEAEVTLSERVREVNGALCLVNWTVFLEADEEAEFYLDEDLYEEGELLPWLQTLDLHIQITASIEEPDESEVILPETGGSGILLHVLLGSLLLLWSAQKTKR